jgi:PPM family protein phosphatase
VTNRSRPLAERSAAASECGRRRTNEDAVLLATLSTGAELAAAADGMGGYAGGAVASRRTLEVLRASLEAGATLEDAVRSANAAVFQEASQSTHYQGMGTTLVALLRQGPEYRLVNVGDSRAYRVDRNGIEQLTRDHSFVADAIRAGQLSAEEVMKSRWRNAVTRAVGTQRELEVDSYGPFDALEPHAIVLVTDGLYRVIPDAALREAIVRATAPESAVRGLASAAYDAGSDDNISVVLMQFGPEAAAPPAEVPVQRPEVPVARPRAERRAHARRWTLPEIVLILLGIIILTYAVLRMLWS